LLHRGDSDLTLQIRNDGAQTLRDIRVVFRLPLLWKDGTIRRMVTSLAPGAVATIPINLAESGPTETYVVGSEFDVAQIDFQSGNRVRLYAVCEAKYREPESYFARDGFWVLGPLPGDIVGFDPQAYMKAFLYGEVPKNHYLLGAAEVLGWKMLPHSRASILDPDIIPTTGSAFSPNYAKWDPALFYPHSNPQYVLYGRIVSPDDRIVRAVFSRRCVRQMSLNGRAVAGDELPLVRGMNDIRILFASTPGVPTVLSENNYGCYFRLVQANGKRPEDLRFERPPSP